MVSSVILGFMWGVWHLPLFFGASEAVYYQKPIWGFIFSDILFALLITWIYNNTSRSLVGPLVVHTIFILSTVMFPALETDLGSLYYFILFVIAVVTVLAIWGPRRMVRERSRSIHGT